MHSVSRRSILAASIAMGAAPSVAAAMASAPVRAPPEGVIPVFLSGQRAVILVRSRGRGPFPMVFDTGTSGNSIDTRLARELRLHHVQGAEVVVVDGATGTSFTTHASLMPDIHIGDYVVGDSAVSVYDYQRDNEVGVFGPTLFTGRLVQVDLANGRVRIRAKSEASARWAGRINYLGEPGDALPALEIGLPRHGPLLAILDTGNDNELILPPEFVDKVPLEAPPTIVGRQTSVSGSRDVLGGKIRGDVQIGPITLSNPEVIFSYGTANVGLPVLRRLQFLLDPEGECGWLLGRQAPSAAELSAFGGQFGERSIRLQGERLIYQRQGGPERELHALGCDLFEIGGTQDQIDFRRENGSVSGFTLVTDDYRAVDVAKTA